MRRLLALLAVLAFSANDAAARDLRGRFALGFREGFDGTSALTARYTLPTPDPAVEIQIEGFGGFSTSRTLGTWALVGGRATYGFVVEDNMNLYGIGGAALYMQEGDKRIRVQPALGAEFFLFGLENLGLMAEWGVNIDVGDATGVSTTAAAGVHYWF